MSERDMHRVHVKRGEGGATNGQACIFHQRILNSYFCTSLSQSSSSTRSSPFLQPWVRAVMVERHVCVAGARCVENRPPLDAMGVSLPSAWVNASSSCMQSPGMQKEPLPNTKHKLHTVESKHARGTTNKSEL
eukprot:9471582-Pyramimonas_sp.AAC.1